MASQIDEGTVQKALSWAYDKAVNGIAGMDSAIELAEDYLQEDGSLSEQVDALIRWQNAKCATSGFITNLGGLITLPVAIPANMASTLYVQVRMIAAIAYMGGYDLKNNKVRDFVYLCLCGNEVKDILKKFSIELGRALTKQAIKNISISTINQINRMVGMKLVTKFGEKSLISLGKGVPIIGGLIGGTIDGIACNTIGNVAKEMFIK